MTKCPNCGNDDPCTLQVWGFGEHIQNRCRTRLPARSCGGKAVSDAG